MRLTPSFLALFPLVLCACGGGDAEPSWLRLAVELEDSAIERFVSEESAAGDVARLVHDEHGDWIQLTIARTEWRHHTELDLWLAPATGVGVGKPAGDEPSQRLQGGDRAFAYSPPSLAQREWTLSVGGFYAAEQGTFLRLPPGIEPPAEAVLSVFATRVSRPDGTWRVAGERFSGDGFVLANGEVLQVTADLPASSVLRAVFAFEPASKYSEGAGALTFRVTLDGEEIARERFENLKRAESRRFVVELPTGGRAGAVLGFEVEGPFVHAAVLTPVVGPREVGRVNERPWGAGRPDQVVFLADTFRADNMAHYGGTKALTPNLDRFARRSAFFRRAWSVGTYTLPAHVSMFSGLFPLQAGIVGKRQALPEALPTLAEELARHGYRTGAITDSVIVSSRYGMDQGFGWFDEINDDIDRTLERVREFLDADDGRPVFLFVQTYRTHTPYHVTEATLAKHGERLGIEGAFAELDSEWVRLNREGDLTDPRVRQRRGWLLEKMKALYLGGVIDLDQAFESFRLDLDGRGMLERGNLIFTSDHGEAFYEHDAGFHPGKVWEELARVPFLIGGGSVGARTIEEPASLIDLAPTVATLAGVEPRSEWLGRALLGDAVQRPVFIFQCVQGPDATLALIEGDRKVIAYEDAERLSAGDIYRAFDLATDPGERRDRAREAWAKDILERLGPAAGALLEAVVDPSSAALDPARLQELRDLGYAGED